jgi:hypothetical protein
VRFGCRVSQAEDGHEALQLCAQAAAGQIILSERAYWRVADRVEVARVADLDLKGFARPVPAYNVVRLRPGLRRRPTLVGPARWAPAQRLLHKRVSLRNRVRPSYAMPIKTA